MLCWGLIEFVVVSILLSGPCQSVRHSDSHYLLHGAPYNLTLVSLERKKELPTVFDGSTLVKSSSKTSIAGNSRCTNYRGCSTKMMHWSWKAKKVHFYAGSLCRFEAMHSARYFNDLLGLRRKGGFLLLFFCSPSSCYASREILFFSTAILFFLSLPLSEFVVYWLTVIR